MSAYGDHGEQKAHQHILKTGASVPQPTNLWLALFEAPPSETNDSTGELSGGGYVRQQVSSASPKFVQSAGNASQAENDADIVFPVATGQWASGLPIDGWAIYDASTAGNKWFKGTFAVGKIIEINDQLKIGAGDLTISFD